MNTTSEPVVQVLDPTHEKGIASEMRGATGLQIMAHRGSEIKELKTPPVVGFFQAKRYSRLDRHGIDLVAILADGHQIPISVRSSMRSLRNYHRRHKMRQANGWFVALAEAVLIKSTDKMFKVIKILAEHINRWYVIVRRETDRIRFARRLQAKRRHGRVPERGTFVRQVCFSA